MKGRGTWLWITALTIVVMVGCTSQVQEPAQSPVAQTAPPSEAPAAAPTPVHAPPAEEALPELKLTSLSVKDFLAKFHYRSRPDACFIPLDFEKKIDPTLQHFDRVEVILEDGKRTELRMQSFGAWAIYKNFDGNYEMLTTMITNIGVLMHLHTLNPKFETLGSIEVARRSYIEGDETVKKGKFSDWDNYHYTVVTRRKGALLDSANGHIVVATSGNYKVLDEIR